MSTALSTDSCPINNNSSSSSSGKQQADCHWPSPDWPNQKTIKQQQQARAQVQDKSIRTTISTHMSSTQGPDCVRARADLISARLGPDKFVCVCVCLWANKLWTRSIMGHSRGHVHNKGSSSSSDHSSCQWTMLTPRSLPDHDDDDDDPGPCPHVNNSSRYTVTQVKHNDSIRKQRAPSFSVIVQFRCVFFFFFQGRRGMNLYGSAPLWCAQNCSPK